MQTRLFTTFLLLTISSPVLALPIDWNGSVGFDTQTIKNFRWTDDVDQTASDDSQVIPNAAGEKQNASFQTYKFKLAPSIIVNDSATVKGEITSGYGYGGRFGDNSKQSFDNSFSNSLYMYNTADSSDSNLVLTKLNVNLYSDTGTYIIGRQSSHWGLGAVYNDGSKPWDRHATIRDGIAVKYKISNFYLTPYYYKIDLNNGLTKRNAAKELGIEMLYDNPERDMSIGLVFGEKKSKGNNTFFTTESDTTTTRQLNSTNAKVIDVYLQKMFGRFNIEVEAPFLSGELGELYEDGSGNNVKYKANAILTRSTYSLSDNLKLGLHAGLVSGDDGGRADYQAMYLHPNYQIANLMFRYNMNAISDPTNVNLYDSYITNTTYLKLDLNYVVNKWTWDFALIWAKAEETASEGKNYYNHSTNKSIDGDNVVADQDDDYGTEVDFSFSYKWNENVILGGDAGYFFVGDYYKFNNTENSQEVDNSYILALKAMVTF